MCERVVPLAMRVLYLDVDSLRPDHLGCYGYERDTSPTIDRLAESGRRFTDCYASDVPCLPSRTALFTGRLGIHTGVVNHGGGNAEPRRRGVQRAFNTQLGEYRTWMTALREVGHRTALISPFPQRHGAWHVLDGFEEWHDTGEGGRETADIVYERAAAWLEDNAAAADWYCHVNFWDPHAPYDTHAEYGDPFAGEPAPDWLDDDRIREQRASYGPHGAREPHGWGGGVDVERMPDEIAGREQFVEWINGYDTGVRYMDEHVEKLVGVLESAGVREETLIVVSADHGENLGELNVYGDHQTADRQTCRVPLIVSGPGVEPGVDEELHYQIDLAPTITELVGGEPRPEWDGRSFAQSLTEGAAAGREYLVVSQGAWACQRGVRWDDYLLLRTYHDGLKDFEPVELYDLADDPHETANLARERPTLAREGLTLLGEWRDRHRLAAATDRAGGNPDGDRSVTDPLFEVIREGGPYHVRDRRESYVRRLRETDRETHARKVESREGIVPADVTAYLDGADAW